MDKLKKQLQSVFVENAPFQIPEEGRKSLVGVLPFVSLLAGVLALWGAWSAYRLMSTTAHLINYTNTISRVYGAEPSVASSYTFWGWMSVLVLLVEGAIAFMAYTSLQKKHKSGWDLLFLAALINIGYAVITLFSSVSDFGAFLFAIGVSVIGLYVLFQVRGAFDPSVKSVKARHIAPSPKHDTPSKKSKE